MSDIRKEIEQFLKERGINAKVFTKHQGMNYDFIEYEIRIVTPNNEEAE